MRHGQAISNYLGDTLGPDEWYAVEGTCQYDDGKGTIYNIFDAGQSATVPCKGLKEPVETCRLGVSRASATQQPSIEVLCSSSCEMYTSASEYALLLRADLTGLGQDQAKSLNSMLVGGSWFDKLTGGKPVRFVISPLTRYLAPTALQQQIRLQHGCTCCCHQLPIICTVLHQMTFTHIEYALS